MEVLQDDRRPSFPSFSHEALTDQVNALRDPGVFPPSLSSAESAADPSVVSLLPPEPSAANEVSVLYKGDLGVGNGNGGGLVPRERYPIEGPFVGVEGENRLWRVSLGHGGL